MQATNISPSTNSILEKILELDETKLLLPFIRGEKLPQLPRIHLLLLKKLIEETQTNQTELAELLETTQATISRWLNGKRMIDPSQSAVIFLKASRFFCSRRGLDEDTAFLLCQFLIDSYSNFLNGNYFLLKWAKQNRKLLLSDDLMECFK